ncbi:MAG TPA: class I SAM-dependent methyltransferase [Candidatus Acidoferrales bacterium]|nr:class I SAM-dependent methyltransferase [Candidatus Acidoferrales bacterium]
MNSAPVDTHPLHQLLPCLGSDEEFRALHDLLEECGYNREGICRRLEIPEIWEYRTIRQQRAVATETEHGLDVLIRLFLDNEYVSRKEMDALLPAGAAEILERLNLVVPDSERAELMFATVTLYPGTGQVENLPHGVLIASDRATAPDPSAKYWLPADVVYPAVVENTRTFLEAMPDGPCDAFLDLGTGTGIAALIASRFAVRVWASDIATRSAHFAEFNRRLNGAVNVQVVEGDLYEPVEGLTFDRIVTHPPYVPTLRPRFVFRDGGDDGEQIIRRVIEGLPRFLRVGGMFYAVVLGADCEGEQFEERIAKWLGAARDEFDLLLVSQSLRTPKEFLSNAMAKKTTTYEEMQFWQEIWTRRKTEFLFYGNVVLRRHGASRRGTLTRLQKGAGFSGKHLSWVLDWQAETHDPASQDRLLDLHPWISPDCELRVLSRVQEGQFVPQAFSLEVERPFTTECRCQEWLVRLVAGCDGKKSWREHFRQAREGGIIPAEATERDFVSILEAMVTNGILRVPERALPA